uniref:Uncharacterized protein n=1 Tax=Romanomermis culicivorax TaxID=13658 RepID=A0A915HH78_ROMCU
MQEAGRPALAVEINFRCLLRERRKQSTTMKGRNNREKFTRLMHESIIVKTNVENRLLKESNGNLKFRNI